MCWRPALAVAVLLSTSIASAEEPAVAPPTGSSASDVPIAAPVPAPFEPAIEAPPDRTPDPLGELLVPQREPEPFLPQRVYEPTTPDEPRPARSQRRWGLLTGEYFAAFGGELLALAASAGVGYGMVQSMQVNHSNCPTGYHCDDNGGVLVAVMLVGLGSSVSFLILAPLFSSASAYGVSRGDGRRPSWAKAWGIGVAGIASTYLLAAFGGMIASEASHGSSDPVVGTALTIGLLGALATPLLEVLVLNRSDEPHWSVAPAVLKDGGMLAAQVRF